MFAGDMYYPTDKCESIKRKDEADLAVVVVVVGGGGMSQEPDPSPIMAALPPP